MKHDWLILWPLTVFACVVLWVAAFTYQGDWWNHAALFLFAALVTTAGAWAIHGDVQDMRR